MIHSMPAPRKTGQSDRRQTPTNEQPPSQSAIPNPQSAIAAALARRKELLADPATTAIRLINGPADGLDGLVVEKFGDVLIAQLHEGRLALSEPALEALCRDLLSAVGALAVYRKAFPKGRSTPQAELDAANRDPRPWLSATATPEATIAEEFPIREAGLNYLIRPYDGFSVGLFLEQRANRARIRLHADGRRVLNTFAYTCAFGVAAAVGGAQLIVNVDVSKRYLEWGKRNLAVNALPLEKQMFICSDVFDYYRRAGRQNRRFDLVILDPPTFSRCRTGKSAFVLRSELDPLVAGALQLLDPGGLLLLSTNQRELTLPRLEKSIHLAAGPRRVQILEYPALPTDFAGDADFAKSIWARID